LNQVKKALSYIYFFGARNVTVTPPGFRPISIAPLMVARFITSGTVISNKFAALYIPFAVASLSVAPVPTEIRYDSSSSIDCRKINRDC